MRVNWPRLAMACIVLVVGAFAAYAVRFETPVGTIRGTVVAQETGAALHHAEIYLSPLAEGARQQWTTTNADGSFELRNVPSGSYEVTALTKFHTLRSTNVVISEGAISTLDLELEPNEPHLELRTPQHVFGTQEPPSTLLYGFLDSDQVELRVYSIDFMYLAKTSGSLRDLLYIWNGREWVYGPAKTDKVRLISTTRVALTTKDVEGVFKQRVHIPTDGPGAYMIEVRSGSIIRQDWLVVSDIAIITKQAGPRLLVRVVDRKSGHPIPGAEVTASDEREQIYSGIADKNGLVDTTLPFDERTSTHIFAAARWHGSLAFTDNYQWFEDSAGATTVLSYTDRPVYRPGQEVHFKGIVRERRGVDYAVPPPTPVTFEVRDQVDTLIYRGRLQTNGYGSYNGTLSLPKSAISGDYSMTATVNGKPHYSGFKIASYVKPEYKVSIETKKPRYIVGDTVEATVKVEYFFGAPVAGANVSYTIYRKPRYAYEEYYEESEEYEGYDSGNGESIRSYYGHTDKNGKLVVKFKTESDKAEAVSDADDSVDYTYTVEANVYDESWGSESAEKQILVAAGEFRIDLTPATWVVSPGSALDTEVTVQDHGGKPLSGVRLQTTLDMYEWRGGSVRYRTADKQRITTGKDGTAKVRFTAKEAGSYRVRATAKDKRKNTIISSQWIWVTSSGYADLGGRLSGVDIVTDKREYKVGDTAKIVINSENKGASALLTIEGDTIYDVRTINLRGTTTLIDLPITKEYAPNVFISVCYVKDGDMISNTKRITVSAKERALQVDVKPSKKELAPGEQVSFAITTKDERGRGVPAEVSLGVVDEAIYSIAPDETPKMADFFYPVRVNRVDTKFSFPEIYLDADKSPATMQVRKDFRDTAFWQAAVVTDSRGEAMVSFALPDNLTTWRATARAHTRTTAVGEATAKVLVTKPLLVRISVPRFFTQLDEATVSGIVHNYTKGKQRVTVKLDAKGLRVRGHAERRITLKPDEARRIDWTVEVPNAGDARVTLSAQSKAGPSDAMQITIPCLPHGRLRVENRVGIVSGKTEEKLYLPNAAIPAATQLQIRVGPSTVASMFSALDYLATYPYGCTEQTMSAFMPDIIVWKTLKRLGRSDPDLERRLPGMVAEGLVRLYEKHHDDGGWGWWEYDESTFWMTAYVVNGLMEARDAGFEVRPYVLNSGEQWLKQRIMSKRIGNRDLAYGCYVLSRTQHRDAIMKRINTLSARAYALDAEELAMLALTLHEVGRDEDAARAMSILWQRANESRALTHWSRSQSAESFGSDVEATAWCLKAVCTLTPHDPRIPKVARWAGLQRRGDYWVSTKDTSLMIDALCSYVAATKALSPNCVVTVKVNGQEVATLKFTPADVWDPEVVIPDATLHLHPGTNRVTFAKKGQGDISYSLTFSRRDFAKNVGQLVAGSGIQVERSYHRLSTQTDETTWETSYIPSQKPVDRVRAGDMFLVRVKVTAREARDYVLIEDPIPAGCSVVEKTDVPVWAWDRWWSYMDVRDDKVAVFATRVPAGESVIEYKLRADVPGRYTVMPTVGYGMYEPDVRCSGAQGKLVIRK